MRLSGKKFCFVVSGFDVFSSCTSCCGGFDVEFLFLLTMVIQENTAESTDTLSAGIKVQSDTVVTVCTQHEQCGENNRPKA